MNHSVNKNMSQDRSHKPNPKQNGNRYHHKTQNKAPNSIPIKQETVFSHDQPELPVQNEPDQDPHGLDNETRQIDACSPAEPVQSSSQQETEPIKIVGIRFKQVGKIYYFDPGEEEYMQGQAVIVETARGVEYGKVELPNRYVSEDQVIMPLKKVLRAADEDDHRQVAMNKQKEEEAFTICLQKIKDHQLDMKLIDVEITFDLTKILFYFTSDGRVDFRELVKDLAAIFRTRIELRQIGVRDEAKMLNGIGICGISLCCATFLGDFQPVSIKMAKEQNLPLNPTKISGICGRLMCCLKYEEETYEDLNRNLPNAGDFIETPDGRGEVLSVNVLRQLIKAAVRKRSQDDPIIGFYALDEIKILTHKKTEEKPVVNGYDLHE